MALTNNCNCGNSSNCTCKSKNSNINVFKGSTLKIRVDFPFSLAGNTVSIVYSNKTALLTPVITVIDADAGTVEIAWTDEQIDTLELGSNNKIRFGVTFLDGTQQNYNLLRINVI